MKTLVGIKNGKKNMFYVKDANYFDRPIDM